MNITSNIDDADNEILNDLYNDRIKFSVDKILDLCERDKNGEFDYLAEEQNIQSGRKLTQAKESINKFKRKAKTVELVMSVKVSSNRTDATKRIQALARGYLVRIGWSPLLKSELLLYKALSPSKETNWLVYPTYPRRPNFGNPIFKRTLSIDLW